MSPRRPTIARITRRGDVKELIATFAVPGRASKPMRPLVPRQPGPLESSRASGKTQNKSVDLADAGRDVDTTLDEWFRQLSKQLDQCKAVEPEQAASDTPDADRHRIRSHDAVIEDRDEWISVAPQPAERVDEQTPDVPHGRPETLPTSDTRAVSASPARENVPSGKERQSWRTDEAPPTAHEGRIRVGREVPGQAVAPAPPVRVRPLPQRAPRRFATGRALMTLAAVGTVIAAVLGFVLGNSTSGSRSPASAQTSGYTTSLSSVINKLNQVRTTAILQMKIARNSAGQAAAARALASAHTDAAASLLRVNAGSARAANAAVAAALRRVG